MSQEQVPTGPHATRGFTTLQLLELAVVGLTKLYTSQGQAPIITEVVNGQTVQRRENLAGGNKVSSKIADALGIPLPKGTKMHVMDKMVKAGWFHDGRGQGENARPFAAISNEGRLIESKRGEIYNIAASVLRELQNPANYQAHVVGGVQRAPAGSGELEPMLRSSYSWGVKKGQTLQGRIAALTAVWALTQPNQEPPPPERAAGRGGFGTPKPASLAQANVELQQSNGFLNRNVSKFLAKLISKRTVGKPSAEQLQASARVGQVLRQRLNLGGTFDLSLEQAKLVKNAAPKALFDQVVNDLGGAQQAAQTLWLASSTAAIKELIGGFTIYKPNWTDEKGKAHKDWVHVAGATGANPEGNAAEFTRYVYNQLFGRYAAPSGGVDRQSAEAAKKSERRPGSRGLLGNDDVALKNLTANDAKKVAAFVGKARKGFYTMDALRDGAQKLGIAVDPNAILHDVVIQTIADNVIRAYSADVGQNVDRTLAVAAALGITGFSKGIHNNEQHAAARAAILRKLDAMNGRLTAPCNAANYKKKDLKRIAKAHQVSTDKIKSAAAACMALADAGVQVEQASPDVLSSGRRGETAKPRAPSQAKKRSGGKGRQPTILEGLAGTNYSPGRAQALGVFMGGQQLQQPTMVQQPVVMAQPLSGSFSPGGTRRARPMTVAPTLGGGLGTLGGGLATLGGQQPLTMGGVQPSVIGVQPGAGAGAGLAFPSATGGAAANPLNFL